jgi:hypothetical protein
MPEMISYAEEIKTNTKTAEVSSQVASIETADSSLCIRLRGAYITDCELTSPTNGRRIDVLYSEADLTKPKITATHPMVPAGPHEGIGGQHGFPRWSDYHEFPLEDGPNDEKRVAVQAKRSDNGLSLVKYFELTESTLTAHTTIRAEDDTAETTSMGEHMYFSLADEEFDGLKINGQTLDELLGEGSQHTVENDGTLYWDFGGEANIDFPAGHSVKVSAAFEGDTKHPLAMWIWKRPGSPSICFEPIVGVENLDDDDTSGVRVPPYGSATLSTRVELL